MFTTYEYEEVRISDAAWERAVAEASAGYGNPEDLLIAEEEEESEEW